MLTQNTKNDNPIARALALASPRPIDFDPAPFMILKDLDKSTLGKIASSFDLTRRESQTVKTLLESIDTVRKESHHLEAISRRHRYLELPADPLGWRDADGWPVLVPFRLDDPAFSLDINRGESYCHWESCKEYWRIKINQEFPSVIRDQFTEVKNWQSEKGPYIEPIRVEWKTFFSGLIPMSVVPVIKEAQPFFDGIFIIAEVSGYTITALPAPKPKPIDPDPLVVGHYDGKLYLIAAFDLTPLEQAYIKTGVRQLERSQDCIMIHQIAGLLN